MGAGEENLNRDWRIAGGWMWETWSAQRDLAIGGSYRIVRVTSGTLAGPPS